MVCNDTKYKQVTNRIGIALIVLALLIQNVIFVIPEIFGIILDPINLKLSYTVRMLLQIVLYMAAFILPAILLRALLKKRGLEQPLRLEFKMSASALWLVPAGIAVCLSASLINSYIMNIFVDPEAMQVLLGETVPYEPYQIVLYFVATAIVPAVCEEFLFRGAVASSLMPYGKGVAVVGSSLLFALMHQNPYQLFYTFLAGLFLGYLYVKTGSILCSTILHFCNNAVSVLMEVVMANLGESVGNFYYCVILAVVYLLGALGVVAYFVIEKKKSRGRYDDGSFGKLIETDNAYEQMPITRGKLVKYFFTPGMIVYCCITVLNIVSMVVLLKISSVVSLWM